MITRKATWAPWYVAGALVFCGGEGNLFGCSGRLAGTDFEWLKGLYSLTSTCSGRLGMIKVENGGECNLGFWGNFGGGDSHKVHKDTKKMKTRSRRISAHSDIGGDPFERVGHRFFL